MFVIAGHFGLLEGDLVNLGGGNMNRGAISTVVAIALVLVSCSQQTDNAKSMATKSPDGSNNSASTAQNSTVGVVELEKRVASGDMQATYELVGRYLLGKGVERDRRKALALLSGRNVETDRRLLRESLNKPPQNATAN
ncbi:MAG: hypothetical protein OEL86_18415 [Sulfuritalea sp.]|nr:hypothetical protein [Sulfuritalea sp.]